MNKDILNNLSNTFLGRITQYFIRRFLRSSYQHAYHRFVIRIMMKTIMDEQHAYSREDNEPTAVAFVVEQVILASDLEEDWPMYLKLMELVGSEKPEFYQKRYVDIKKRSLENAVRTQEGRQKDYDHAVETYQTDEIST